MSVCSLSVWWEGGDREMEEGAITREPEHEVTQIQKILQCIISATVQRKGLTAFLSGGMWG